MVIQTFDAIVIGAGVQGASTAFHLSTAGVKKILLLDELDAAGRGSSGRSGSMLMKSRENRAKIAFSKYSYDWLHRFENHFHEQLTFRKTGFLSIVPGDLRDRYLQEHRTRLECGVPSQVLDPSEIKSLVPAVVTDGIEFGVLGPDDGVIDPNQLVRSYLRVAEERGAQTHLQERVVGLDTGPGNTVRVRTANDQYDAPIVVNAAGPGAGKVSAMIGLPLPVQNFRRSLYFVTAADPRLQSGPMVEESGVECYFRGLGKGRVLIGMGLESEGGASDAPDLEFWRRVHATASQRTPSLADAQLYGGTSGLRPLTPDSLPIIGPAPRAPGVFLNCGWGGEGIMHSPAGGRMTVDSIFGASTDELDWTVCRVDRFFASHNLDHENTTGGEHP